MLDEFDTPKVTATARPARPEPMAPGRKAPVRAKPDTSVMDSDTLDRIKVIEAAIEEIRPYLKRDGGDCELVDVEGNTIYVKLTGACVGCHMASVTISGVQERLMAMLRVPLRVIPVG